MTQTDAEVLAEIRQALREPNVALHLVRTVTHGRGVQVKIKTRKIGPVMVCHEGQTLVDLLALIGGLASDEQPSGHQL